jgi:hypothetical protein
MLRTTAAKIAKGITFDAAVTETTKQQQERNITKVTRNKYLDAVTHEFNFK